MGVSCHIQVKGNMKELELPTESRISNPLLPSILPAVNAVHNTLAEP